MSKWVKLEVLGDERTLFPTSSSTRPPPARW
jgi:thiazole synthase ThiGH ThiG subunit